MARAPVRPLTGFRLVFAAVAAVVIVAGVAIVAVPRLRGLGPPGAGGAGSPGASSSAAGDPVAPRFVEQASAAGIEHRYDGEFLYFVGGGVAAMDCNDDGRPDLYFAGGSGTAALYRNESATGGALRFSRIAAPSTDLTAVTGAYPLDVDSDGRVDLAVLRTGENVLLRGLGACRFERANERWGFDGARGWTTAFSATWERGAKWPTLAFGHYLGLDSAGESTDDCDAGSLVRPAASGNRFDKSIRLQPSWCTLSVLFSDWSRTGRRDLRVSNDRHYYSDYSEGEEQLWRVEPGGAPQQWTREQGWQTVRIWGMGIASRDLTGDGLPEIYLTSQGDNKLQTLAEDAGTNGATAPKYGDMALRAGVTAHRPYAGGDALPSTAWHPEFDDLNNDGYVDLFVTKGNVEAMTEYAARDPNNLLLGRPDGTFVEAAPAAGIVQYARARGAAVTDLNMDGLLDIVVVNRRENVSLWRNMGAAVADGSTRPGQWISLRARQPSANRDAVGAWIDVRTGARTATRELTVGGGHAGGELGWMHAGLGAAESAEVRITWPDGHVGPWMTLAANGFYTIERERNAPEQWHP